MKKTLLYCLSVALLFFVFAESTEAMANKGRPYYEDLGLILWDIETKEKVVAITFDDGPHRQYTSEVLDLLEKYHAKATFFIVGENAEKNPDVLLRMYLEGHELANHTYTHPRRTSVLNLQKEIQQTNKLISDITGFEPNLFRPVEGHFTDTMITHLAHDGFKVVMWSWHLDTEDWKEPGVNVIVNRVLKGTKPGNIILFHDGGGNREQTVIALEKILMDLQEQDYQFVTVSQLLTLEEKEKSIQK